MSSCNLALVLANGHGTVGAKAWMTYPCLSWASSSNCTSVTVFVKYFVAFPVPGAYSSTISNAEPLPMATSRRGLLIAVAGAELSAHSEDNQHTLSLDEDCKTAGVGW